MGDTGVDFFLEILKHLGTSSSLDLAINEKHQLEYLEEKIEYLRGFLKVTEKKRNEHSEVMKLVTQIRDVVSEAEIIVRRFIVDPVKADASCSLSEHQDHLYLSLESVKKEIKTLTDEVLQIYDENMYDINGVGVQKLEHSSTRSGDYDKSMKRNLLICILKSTSSEKLEDYEKSSEDLLGEKVHKCLKGRKYLIVMDDIWGIEAWNDIRRSFPKECKESKVLFTSRLVQPDSVNCVSHYLAPLQKHWSWKLLEKKVFGMKGCPQELVGIGEQIAGKCDGLPLAIIAVAGILVTEDKTLNVWKEVAKSLSSIIANKNQEGCMDILELSYHHLPLHLKKCFVYIGGFPEDYEIPIRELMWLWIAKGFIQQSEGGERLEAVAKDYLIGLIDRSLVMIARKSSLGEIKACRIHDLLRVLCLKKAKEDKFHVQIYRKGDSFSPFAINKHRYLFFGQEFFLKFRRRNLNYLLSSDFFLATCAIVVFHLGSYVSPAILKVLEFNLGMYTIKLPSDILKIVELRHLHSKKEVFKDHFSHLSSKNAARIGFDSSSKLDSLQTLHRICSCKNCRSFLVKTPNLKKLGFFGELMSRDGVLMLPDLEFLKCLEKLSFTNLRFFDESVESSTTLPVGLKLPPTITQITLKDTLLKWEELSILQTLPSLEVLKLLEDACRGYVWNANEIEGFFQLKYLRFDFLFIQEWNASEDQFPRLEVLVLERCFRLKQIPIDFANLNELREIKLVLCTQSAEDSAREIQEVHRNKKGDDDCLYLLCTRHFRKSKEITVDLYTSDDVVYGTNKTLVAPTSSPLVNSTYLRCTISLERLTLCKPFLLFTFIVISYVICVCIQTYLGVVVGHAIGERLRPEFRRYSHYSKNGIFLLFTFIVISYVICVCIQTYLRVVVGHAIGERLRHFYSWGSLMNRRMYRCAAIALGAV